MHDIFLSITICLTLICCSVIALVPPGEYKKLNIGVLIQDEPRERSYIRAALELAKQPLDEYIKYHGYEIDYIYESSGSFGCDDVLSVGGAAKLINLHKVRALIGPQCSSGCIAAGLISNYENVPMVSFGCSASGLSNLSHYPTFARTKPYARTTPRYLSKLNLNC
jgi:ABC-type branched-chain amino acid transport systems, periplasmic component